MNTRRKVSIIGAGNTGSTLAFVLSKKEISYNIMIDSPQSDLNIIKISETKRHL